MQISFMTIASLLLSGIGAATFIFALKMRTYMWHLRQQASDLKGDVRALREMLKDSSSRQIRAIEEGSLAIISASCLTSLGLKFPVFLGGWSIDPFLARWLVQHLQASRPKCIVELGSGSSTIVIARTLGLLNESDVTHITIDHEAQYLDATRQLAELNDVAGGIRFIHCPLVHYEKHGMPWYSDLARVLDGLKIDLLLIDGPPGPLQPMSRLPALPELQALLADQCTVVLDDAVREDEKAIARSWLESTEGFKLRFESGGHGLAILDRRT